MNGFKIRINGVSRNIRRGKWLSCLIVSAVVLSVFIFVFGLVSPPNSHAAFPGVNGKIAFNSTRDGNSEVYVMEPDGSNPTNLTMNSAIDINPAWSADGTKIAFSSNRDGNFEIYVMDADGSNQTRITNNTDLDDEPT